MINLAKQLINEASITPDDKNCQSIITERLEKLGFTVTKLKYGEVDNLWAKIGDTKTTVVFAGHTDVVPVGDESKWQIPPFERLKKMGFYMGEAVLI